MSNYAIQTVAGILIIVALQPDDIFILYYFHLNIISMKTAEIANRLVSMCRDGKVEEAKEELFAPNIKSIEPHEGLLPKEIEGMQAIRDKAALFISHVENFFGQS